MQTIDSIAASAYHGIKVRISTGVSEGIKGDVSK